MTWSVLFAQVPFGVPGLDTNAGIINFAGSGPVASLSPVGAFLIGFAFMLVLQLFGLLLRSVRWVGHSGGDQ